MEEAETARAVSTHAFTKKVINKTALPLCLDSIGALSVEKLEWRSLWFMSFSGTKMLLSPADEARA